MNKKRLSLKWAFMTAVLVCWITAVLIVISISGILINYNFTRNIEQRSASDAEKILSQIEIRFSDSMESSKKISYDGVVRNAYQQYMSDGNSIAFYRTLTQYLSSGFSRDAKFKAVFISFWEEEISSRIYVINQKTNSYKILQQFISDVRPRVMEKMKDADTQIQFMVNDGELYMCRNLLNSHYEPYATVTMLCDSQILLQPLLSFISLGEATVAIDDNEYTLSADGYLTPIKNARESTIQSDSNHSTPNSDSHVEYICNIDGHTFGYHVVQDSFHIWTDLPGLKLAIIVIFALIIPILIILFSVFHKTVSVPVETLADAYQRVQSGERGYEITAAADSTEFQTLYQQFNAMSEELKSQFERSQLEQQALQQAKIRALQSQINPHFLNNTLEVINWEARLAGNDSVSEMIDALSTMLEATLDRDGTGTASLRREMEYVDAYLMIICRRLGNRLHIIKHIDSALQNIPVPKLMLQPIVENAVEHDITPRKGGTLEINASAKDGFLTLKVLHEGTMTNEDRANIKAILTFSEQDLREFRREKGKHIGLKNVAMRLRLLYGADGTLQVEELNNGLICATICLPCAEQQ